MMKTLPYFRFCVYLAFASALTVIAIQEMLADEVPSKGRPGTVEVTGIRDQHIAGEEAIVDLNSQGTLLLNQGNPKDAEHVFQQALLEVESKSNVSPSLYATVLNGLGLSLFQQQKYAEAEKIYEQAKQLIDTAHLDNKELKALVVDNLGQAYRLQGKLKEAEPCYKEALAIEEITFGPNAQDTAITKCNLGLLYMEEERYKEAESYLGDGMSILRNTIGESSPGYRGLIPPYKKILTRTGLKSRIPGI